MAVAALIVAVVSLAFAFASAYFAKGQLEQAKKANALLTAIDLFREFRTMRRTRHGDALRQLRATQDAVPMNELPHEVIDLAHLLDNIGMLVAENLVPPELVAGYMGTTVIDLWNKLGPSIERERKRRLDLGQNDEYQAYFEYLAKRMERVDPAKVRARLKQ